MYSERKSKTLLYEHASWVVQGLSVTADKNRHGEWEKKKLQSGNIFKTNFHRKRVESREEEKKSNKSPPCRYNQVSLCGRFARGVAQLRQTRVSSERGFFSSLFSSPSVGCTHTHTHFIVSRALG